MKPKIKGRSDGATGFFQSCNATAVAGCKLRLVKAVKPSGKLRLSLSSSLSYDVCVTCNPQLRLHFGLRNSVSCSRKQALAFGKKPNARFAVLQTAIRGCASAMLKTMQILALHSAFTRIQGTEDSGIGKNAQSCVFCSNFAV